MRRSVVASCWRVAAVACALASTLGLAASSAAQPISSQERLAVRARQLLPVSGPPIEDAVVLIEGARIQAVGRADEVPLPPGIPTLEGAVVTPGLIDAHTSVGLSGLRNVGAVLDQDETTDPDQADLRAIDAFDPREPLLRHLLEHGVTLVQTGPGPRVPIAGQAGVFRTTGETADQMAVRFPSAMVFNLGETPKHVFGEDGEFPSTRMGTAALIRRRLSQARLQSDPNFVESWLRASLPPDPRSEALARVTRGELPALFVAHRADDLLTAVRLSQEFGLNAVLAGGTEAYLVRDRLRGTGLSLIAGPVMERPSTPERENASYENPALLVESEIPIALRSGFESYVPRNRVVLYEASVAVANGLASEAALQALTLDAARILAIDTDFGSIEAGKVADLVVFDGDPFEYTSHVEAVVVDGRLVYRRASPGGP